MALNPTTPVSDSLAARPAPGRLAPRLLRIVGVAFIILLLCECFRQLLPDDLAEWVPAAITILFSSLAAALFGWDVLRRQQRLHDQLRDETGLRRRLEELTHQLAEESERRRRATEELRESEQRYRTLVEHAPECISVLDATTGKFMDVNSHAVELYGLEREQLFQVGPLELSPPFQPDGQPSAEAARAWIQQALDGGAPIFEWTHRHPVRGDFPCEVRLVAMPGGERTLVRGSLTDISERKRIERELRRAHDELEQLVKERTAELARANEALRAEVTERQRAEARWRELVEHAPDIILSMLRDGTILYVNHVVPGLTIDQVVGSNARSYVPPDQHAKFAQLLESVFATGQPVAYEGFGVGPHGRRSYYATRLHPVVQDGQVMAATMITNDITERKQMEESLRRERDFIAAVLDSVRILVMVVDPQGRVLRVSRACELTLGYRRAELQDRALWDLLAVPEEAALVRDAFAAFGGSRKFPAGLLDHWRTREGPPRLLEWTASVVNAADGRPEHLILTGLDITERERARQALTGSESPQRLLLEQVPAILWTTDRELRFTTGTGAGLAQLGLQTGQAQMVGTSIYTYFHTDDPDNPNIAAHRRALAGERAAWETEWLGRTFQSLVEALRDPQGEIIGTVGIALDVTERKQAEAALRESEERLQLTLEASNIGLFSWQIQAGTIYYSPRWKAQLGYEDHELPNRYEEWSERLHPDDRERMQATVRDYLAQPWPDYEAEFRLRHRDGSYRWIVARAMLDTDARGQPLRMLGCHLDITDRKHMEESLRARESQLRNLGDNLPNGTIFQMIKRPDGTRAVPYISAGVEQLFGVTVAAVMADPNAAYHMILPDDIPAIQEMEQESERALTPFNCVFRTRGPDGETRWFHCRSAPQRLPDGATLWNGVTIDETARYRAEEQLRASEKRFRALIEKTSDCVTLLDNQGIVLYASPGITRVLGYTVEEYVGTNSFDGLHSEDIEDSQQRFAKLLAQPSGEVRKRIRYRHRDGSWRWIEAVGSNLLDDPAVGALVVNFRDVTENQRAEEALFQREREIRALVEHSPDVIARYDRALRYQYINPAVEKASGRPPAHYLGKTNAEVGLPAATAAVWETRLRRAFDERTELHFESEYLAETGPIHYESRLVPEFAADGSVESVLVVSRDITERKRAEEALRRSQASLESAQMLARLGSWEWDPRTDYRFFSKELYEIYRRDPALGVPTVDELMELIHPEDRPLIQEAYGRLTNSTQPVTVEYRSNPALGPVRHLCCTFHRPTDGQSTLLSGTVLDITERKLAELALRESEERFHAFMNNSPTIAFMKDEAGRLVYVNRTLESAFGYDRGAWQGKTDFDLFPFATADKLRGADLEILQSGALQVLEETAPTPGDAKHWLTFKFPFRDSHGRLFLAGIGLDITERKRAENRLQAALREKDTLLKEVHHRVKNNLAIVDSLLNMQEGKVQEPAASALLRDCRNRIHSMAAIHDFLYRSKNFSRIDVAAYLQTLCIHLCRSFGAAERRITLDLDVDKLELDLEFAVPVGLLVNELVTNSLKHAFADGRAGRVRVELHRQGADGFVLAVRDDGVGLPADAELRQARSLGLRLVQTLSRQIRGTLETSRVGGTGFTVVVPQPSAKEPPHGQDQSVAGGG